MRQQLPQPYKQTDSDFRERSISVSDFSAQNIAEQITFGKP